MWNELNKEYNSNTAEDLDPSRFIRLIKRVAKNKGNFELSGNKQNDVSEFLLFFVKCLHDAISGPSMMIHQKPTSKISGIVWDMIKAETNDYSGINDIFYGIYVTEITKKNSNRVRSVKAQQFFVLELSIKNCNNIYDCFEEFTKKELLKGENKWYNEKTKLKEEVNLQTKFFRLPNVLVIMFNLVCFINF